MQDPPKFDYDQPSRDTLAGIYVEACDSAETSPIELPGEQKKPLAFAPLELLFGITVTVDDRAPSD